jgi:hypothetical protein
MEKQYMLNDYEISVIRFVIEKRIIELAEYDVKLSTFQINDLVRSCIRNENDKEREDLKKLCDKLI